VTVDGAPVPARLLGRRIRARLDGVPAGRHRVVARVFDYQETRNNENVAAILPNSRRLSTTFRVR
jgi:hypothetical protein